ncbi:MAG: nucleotide sugar dehydrogenase [Anaerovoracaceae bacterium]|jgi:UDP-N-acetyl-D-mannosaminuronic acid dehydrogenase
MKICVIGLGYIGLPTAAMFASAGVSVVGVDRNPRIIEALNRGAIIIEEKGLGDLVSRVVKEGTLRGSLTPEEADAFIIAVPTPITEDKKADMSYVVSATESIVPWLRPGNTVILESTSPVGTVDELMLPILEKSGLKIGTELFVGHSPERVIPGQILKELVNNSRIAGGINPQSAQRIAEIYKTFVQGDIYTTDTRTAELCKVAENTFRDVNIAFANELAKICENLGVNVWEAINLCNKHPRVNIHQPGPGVGGHCIAVDPWFIVEKQPDTAEMIHLSRNINDSMPSHVASEILEILGEIKDPVVTVLGVTYKPNVDDTRESPVLHLIEILKQQNINVRAFDPYVTPQDSAEDISSSDLEEAVKGSDLLVLGVHHDEFKDLPFQTLGRLMRHRNFYDTRNFVSASLAEEAGFRYYLLGSK